jgi:hypothetical protein
MKTKVISFLSGPGAGKSVMAALVFAELKCLGKSCELVQEYAKSLVWQKRFEELNNQYLVSSQQYASLQAVAGEVEYVICDSGLILGIIYNEVNLDNICDKQKTREMILKWSDEFDNIFVFIDRNPSVSYETAGRVQTETESYKIDYDIKELMNSLGLEFSAFISSKDNVSRIVRYILDQE